MLMLAWFLGCRVQFMWEIVFYVWALLRVSIIVHSIYSLRCRYVKMG